jgi:hypothetical protein
MGRIVEYMHRYKLGVVWNFNIGIFIEDLHNSTGKTMLASRT